MNMIMNNCNSVHSNKVHSV